jgi:phytoene desaturase
MRHPEQSEFDVLVIGAGVGGLSVAARLSLNGYRVLVVEALDRVGGRASTRDVDGFRLNTGAIAIELDGPVPRLLEEVGAGIELHVPPERDTVLLWGRRTINVASPPVRWARAAIPTLLRAITAIPRFRPPPDQTTTEWFSRFTRRRTAHQLLDNILGGFFAASGREVPARTFVDYLMKGSAFRFLGYARGGTVEIWKPLAEAVKKRGGEVWLSSEAQSLVFGDDGRVTGAVVERDGEPVTVTAAAVVSNIGPLATARLAGHAHVPAGYIEDVEQATAGSAIITVHFASREPLTRWPALAFAGRSRRLTYAANLSSAGNGQTKPGWHLYSAASTPRPATGPFDLEVEKALLIDDVRDYFDGFDQHARILAWDVTAHDWPAQRAVSGHDLPLETPVPNLWNVGDGVKIGADAGTAACVRTAEAVAARIRSAHPRSAANHDATSSEAS